MPIVESPSGAAASKIIPWQLHVLIQAALELTQHIILKRENYSDSEFDRYRVQLNKCESLIRSLIESFKTQKRLPHDWEYNPSTFVSADADISIFPKTRAASKIIPWRLHLVIQTALELRKHVMRNKLQREVKKAWKGKNDSELELDDNYLDVQLLECEDRIRSYVKSFKKLKQLPHDWEYDPATASTFVSAYPDISEIRNLLILIKKRDVQGKNYTHLTKDLEYKNDSESECFWKNSLDSINGSNKTVESPPSVVLGKRKRTDEGDGAAASKIIPWMLYRMIQDALKFHKNYTQLTKDLKDKNDSELKKALEDEAVQLERCENRVKYLVKKLKLLNQLPLDWEYNPATASTYVFATVDNSALEKLPPPAHKSEAAASKTIPWELHLLIQDALGHRADVMLKKHLREAKNGSGSSYLDDQHEVLLKKCEDRIRFLAKRFKKRKQLPLDWEYDPATASTFVATTEDTSALPETPPSKEKRLGCCSWEIDPNQKFPKTTNVSLDKEEKKIWKDFKEFDKDNRGVYKLDVIAMDKYKRPLRVTNPIVGLTSKFAVTAFNEAIEMYVKKGQQDNIHDFDVVKCDYLKMNESNYYFYITIEAFEERKRGVYDAKVKLKWDDGSKSLMHFVLTDRKPRGFKKPTKLKTHPDSWQDCSKIPHSGMRRRQNRSICRGYDFRTPFGLDFP